MMARRFPGVRYGAARLDNGSDVLGFDTPVSMDHGWGPRVNLYIADADYSDTLRAELQKAVAQELPVEVCGVPTNWDGYRPVFTRRRPIRHRVGFGPLRGYFRGPRDPFQEGPIPIEEWLTLDEQQLRAIVCGPVYRDDTGELALARERLAWYPRDVWLYLMASIWQRIGQEEAFPGRCGDVGDEVGALIITGRLVRDVMRLAFLQERQYAPYAKWFGSAFTQLACAARLTPLVTSALRATTWQERDRALAAAYEVVAERHNELRVTPLLDPRSRRRYESRPYLGIGGGRFVEALVAAIGDERLRALATRRHGAIGNAGHWIDSTDALYGDRWRDAYRRQYRDTLDGSERDQP